MSALTVAAIFPVATTPHRRDCPVGDVGFSCSFSAGAWMGRRESWSMKRIYSHVLQRVNESCPFWDNFAQTLIHFTDLWQKAAKGLYLWNSPQKSNDRLADNGPPQ
ncbi:hypothetical protein GCM10009611_22790 [Arthrobacter roseus]